MQKLTYRWAVKHPWTAIALSLLFVALAAVGVKHLQYNADVRHFFSTDDPQRLALEQVEGQFGKLDSGIIVIENIDGTIFDRQTLATLESITEDAWLIPHSTRVESLSNYQYSWSEQDDLIVEPLVDDTMSKSDADIVHIQEIAVSEKGVVNRLVSPDGRVTGIHIAFNFRDPALEPVESVSQLRSLIEKYEASNPNLRFYLSGRVVSEVVSQEVVTDDFLILIPVMFAVMVITLSTMIGSVLSVFTILFLVSLSVMTTAGLTGWLGIKLNILSQGFHTVIFSVGLAHCVHILSNFYVIYKEKAEKTDAIIKTFELNFVPVALTTLTTLIGFLTMNFSHLPPTRDFGNISAIGVSAIYVLSMILLPAIMQLLPLKPQHSKGYMLHGIMRFAQFIVTYPKRILVITLICTVGLISFASQNTVNEDYTKFIQEGHKFRTDNDFLDQNLGGLYAIDYSIYSGSEGGISEPEYLSKLDELTLWLRQHPEIKNVYSYSDVVKRLNSNMHGDSPDFLTVPNDRELAAQYLLLYEMSLPNGLDLNNQISTDKSATRLTITFPSSDSKTVWRIQNEINDWMQTNLPAVMHHQGSGMSVMFAHVGELIVSSGIMGAVIALSIISVLMGTAMRSVKIGVISVVPNLFPIAVGFGVWGLVHGELGLNLSISLGITIGIIVDDTVHFLMKYFYTRKERNCSAEEAILLTFEKVGPALLITTITLSIGFSVILLSHFSILQHSSVMMISVVVAALILDFMLLPTLLIVLDRKAASEYLEKPLSDSDLIVGRDVKLEEAV